MLFAMAALACSRPEDSASVFVEATKVATPSTLRTPSCTGMQISSAGVLAYSPEIKSLKRYPGVDPSRDGSFFLASNYSGGQYSKLTRLEQSILDSTGRTFKDTFATLEMVELVDEGKTPRFLLFRLSSIPGGFSAPANVRNIEVFSDGGKTYAALFDFTFYPLRVYIVELPAFSQAKPYLVTTLQQAVSSPYPLTVTRVIEWVPSNLPSLSSAQLQVLSQSIRGVTLSVKAGVPDSALTYPYRADYLELIVVGPLFSLSESIVLGQAKGGSENFDSYMGPSVFLRKNFKDFLASDSNQVPKVGQTLLDYVIAGAIRGPTFLWNSVMGGTGAADAFLSKESLTAVESWQKDYSRIYNILVQSKQPQAFKTMGRLLDALVRGDLSAMEDGELQFANAAAGATRDDIKSFLGEANYSQGDVMGLTNPMAIRREKNGPLHILTLSGILWGKWDLSAMPATSKDYFSFLKDGKNLAMVAPIMNSVTRKMLVHPEFAELSDGVMYFGSSPRPNVDDNAFAELKGLIDPSTGVIAVAPEKKLFTSNGELLTPVFKATCTLSLTDSSSTEDGASE